MGTGFAGTHAPDRKIYISVIRIYSGKSGVYYIFCRMKAMRSVR